MRRIVAITAALAWLIGCAQHSTPRPAAVSLRPHARASEAGSASRSGDAATVDAQLEPEDEPQASSDFPMDPESVSLGATLREWVAAAATDTGRPLALVRMTAPRRGYSERMMMTEAVVRDERSGAALSLPLLARRPPVLSMQWWREDVFRDSIARPFAIRAIEDWLNDRPELVSVSRQRLLGTALLWSLSTAQHTTVCATETPAHGAPIEACWTESEPIATVPIDAIEYEYGHRNHLRVDYSLRDSGRRVRAHVDEQGRVRRAESRSPRGPLGPARSTATVTPPTITALAFVEATIEARPDQRALRFSTETEQTRCARADRWRCEAVTAVHRASGAP